MKFSTWTYSLVAAVVLGGSFVTAEPTPQAPSAEPTVVITGARSWRMADGTVHRLRFTGFSKDGVYPLFQLPKGREAKSPSAFAAEDRAVLDALKSGSLKLSTAPGLCMMPDFPNGPIDPDMLHFQWLGETRTWENTNGKRVEARLICLTDEDVSLLIGGNVARVPLKNLGSSDLAYLERLKRGLEPCFPDRIAVVGYGWERGPSHSVYLSGEQYVRLVKRGGDFEKAFAAVIRYVSSQLDSELWELVSFSESLAPAAPESNSILSSPAKIEGRPYMYVGEFFLKKKGELKSRSQWPLNISPRSWPGTPTLRIYATATGDILEPVPSN